MYATNELYEKISAAKIALSQAIARASGVGTARERMKNTLFNNVDDILDALREEDKLAQEICNLREHAESLEEALEEMDAQNDELRKRIREMDSAGTAKKQKSKAAKNGDKIMTAVVE